MSQTVNKVQKLLGCRALVAAEATEPYRHDESGLVGARPDVVALVESVEELRELLLLAERDGIAIVPRGLGTGKVGGALLVGAAEGAGGIVVSMERMRGIREIDEDDLVAIV